MGIKTNLIDEVNNVLRLSNLGTPRFKKERYNTLYKLIKELLDLKIAPESFLLFNEDRFNKLFKYWKQKKNSDSTIRNKISIMRSFFASLGTEYQLPSSKSLSLVRNPKSILLNDIDKNIINQVSHPIVKVLLEMQLGCGLTKLEIIRLNIETALKNDDLFISKRISHNKLERYVVLRTISQKKAVKSLKQILNNNNVTSLADILPIPDICSIYKVELKYLNFDHNIDFRVQYVRDHLRVFEKKNVNKKYAYKVLMKNIGYTKQSDLLRMVI